MGGFNIREIMMDVRFRGKGAQNLRKPSLACNISTLPPEILAHIFSFLPGRDMANAALVCHRFHDATRIENLWQQRCWREFKVHLEQSSQLVPSHLELYTKVLSKYGDFLGLWTLEIASYGGLVEVKFENNEIVGIEWLPPFGTKYMDPLRRRYIFSISLTADESSEVKVQCLRGYNGHHQCQITKRNDTCFASKCCVPDFHRHPEGSDSEYQAWVQEEAGHFIPEVNPLATELLLMKFLMIKQYENSFNFKPLPATVHPPNAIIQPGIFKGTYGDHGLELIHVNYNPEGYVVKATKLTGDPHVPTGKITFRVDLRYSMVLKAEQQQSFQSLVQIRRTTSDVLPHNLPVQPFVVPDNCMDRGSDTPRHCKARFHGSGQIAGHGFTNASYTQGHWIVFNEDLFGFLWLELCSLSVYHRVQEPLTAC